jgi:hypothetical protein
MASLQAIATKRVNAVRTIEKASTALASNLGIEIKPLPNVTKFDPAYAQAMQLEHLAGILLNIAIATKSAKETDFEMASAEVVEVDAAEAEDTEETTKPKKGKKNAK